jgi:hypothetical protein
VSSVRRLTFVVTINGDAPGRGELLVVAAAPIAMGVARVILTGGSFEPFRLAVLEAEGQLVGMKEGLGAS